MGGAHERNVMRWDARRAMLDGEIERLERALAREVALVAADAERVEALRRDLAAARAQRVALGPSPQPKMG